MTQLVAEPIGRDAEGVCDASDKNEGNDFRGTEEFPSLCNIPGCLCFPSVKGLWPNVGTKLLRLIKISKLHLEWSNLNHPPPNRNHPPNKQPASYSKDECHRSGRYYSCVATNNGDEIRVYRPFSHYASSANRWHNRWAQKSCWASGLHYRIRAVCANLIQGATVTASMGVPGQTDQQADLGLPYSVQMACNCMPLSAAAVLVLKLPGSKDLVCGNRGRPTRCSATGPPGPTSLAERQDGYNIGGSQAIQLLALHEKVINSVRLGR
ncbi:hypothetical protein NPIL_484491 [Nephila pilipes]|uniref:Uncharacterized protein n=1 Tax=Nephila pilipes TaxID=299642 RepID=A0A8X6U636_NEPPI|nr:hypothetical protein NPIL_484491 [Nephila pilipes]